MQVRVDPAACTGHGRCYELAPDVFGSDADGNCVVKLAKPGPELEAQARLGERNCPERAIRVDDENSG